MGWINTSLTKAPFQSMKILLHLKSINLIQRCFFDFEQYILKYKTEERVAVTISNVLRRASKSKSVDYTCDQHSVLLRTSFFLIRFYFLDFRTELKITVRQQLVESDSSQQALLLVSFCGKVSVTDFRIFLLKKLNLV